MQYHLNLIFTVVTGCIPICFNLLSSECKEILFSIIVRREEKLNAEKFYENNLKLVHNLFSPIVLARYSNFKCNGILFNPRNSDEHKIYSMPPNK